MPGAEPAPEVGHAALPHADHETAAADVHDAVAPSGPSDAELLALARTGDAPAYAELFRRHAPAARALAMHLARHESEADDLVSEAFTKVLSALRNGHGPTAALRPYLLTALRRVHVDRGMAAQRVKPVEDVTVYDPGEPFVDPALAGLERSLVARAYAQLPERWQTVLWHTEVEGMAPRDLAPLLGMSPNAVSALALRARSGLRDAYLAAHVPAPRRAECEATLPRLTAFVRGSTSARENAQINRHLDGCEDCRTVLADLRDVGAGMRGVIAPLVLGLAAPAYLAKVAALGGAAGGAGSGAASGATSGGTGSAGTSSGGAVAASSSTATVGTSGTVGSLITAVASGGWVVAGAAALVAGAVVAGAVALGAGPRDESPAAVAQATTDEDADPNGSAEPLAPGGGSPGDTGSVVAPADEAGESEQAPGAEAVPATGDGAAAPPGGTAPSRPGVVPADAGPGSVRVPSTDPAVVDVPAGGSPAQQPGGAPVVEGPPPAAGTTDPGTDSGTGVGDNLDDDPGSDPGSDSGSDAGNDPRPDPGTNPGPDPGDPRDPQPEVPAPPRSSLTIGEMAPLIVGADGELVIDIAPEEPARRAALGPASQRSVANVRLQQTAQPPTTGTLTVRFPAGLAPREGNGCTVTAGNRSLCELGELVGGQTARVPVTAKAAGAYSVALTLVAKRVGTSTTSTGTIEVRTALSEPVKISLPEPVVRTNESTLVKIRFSYPQGAVPQSGVLNVVAVDGHVRFDSDCRSTGSKGTDTDSCRLEIEAGQTEVLLPLRAQGVGKWQLTFTLSSNGVVLGEGRGTIDSRPRGGRFSRETASRPTNADFTRLRTLVRLT